MTKKTRAMAVIVGFILINAALADEIFNKKLRNAILLHEKEAKIYSEMSNKCRIGPDYAVDCEIEGCASWMKKRNSKMGVHPTYIADGYFMHCLTDKERKMYREPELLRERALKEKQIFEQRLRETEGR